jgi:hypothetical protein
MNNMIIHHSNHNYSHTEEDQSKEDKEVVALKMVDVFDDAFRQGSHTGWHFEPFGVDEIAPWFYTLSRLGEPFPGISVGQRDGHYPMKAKEFIRLIRHNRNE